MKMLQLTSKYYHKHQRTSNILIMFTYLMTSKLIYLLTLLTYCETFNQLSGLEQVRGEFRTLWNICCRTFCKNI